MDEPIWDGITRAETVTTEAASIRRQFAEHAKGYAWDAVLANLVEYPWLVNTTRLGGHSRYTALHQAAHGGAPTAVVGRLLELGAWRTCRSADGERPVDIARRRGHDHLIAALEPILYHDLPLDALARMQVHFHAVIRGRVDDLVQEHALRLPELEPLLELPTPRLWFPVPGMYGGFTFGLERLADDAVLVTSSWCRVAGGSGQRHLISPYGSLLLDEGFV